MEIRKITKVNEQQNKNILFYYKIFKKSSLLSIFVIIFLISIDSTNFHNNSLYINIYNKIRGNKSLDENKEKCNIYDPINVFAQRFKRSPINICKNNISEHICFQSSKYDKYNKLYRFPYGVICLMNNFTIDPTKSFQTNLTYKGPIDKNTRGAPILSTGFFNMKCKNNRIHNNYSKLYTTYFNSWNYNDDENYNELEELAPGKIILFISRNEDSPNLFHGLSEIINALSVIFLFDLKPENIQIIFLESMIFKNENLLELYTNIISRGNKPMYLRELNRNYHISSAFHIPIGADSPLFMLLNSPECMHPTNTYKLLNNLINKYLNITKFKDTNIYNKEIFYYPKQFNNNSKIITIQWRKVWPKGRLNQKRILGNGPELSDKLSSIIPNNFFIRFVDTAQLPIIQQISIMKSTDYLIGVHGAGLALSIFMPNNSVLHEILPYKKNKLLLLMSKLSGHRTYSDVIKNKIKIIDYNEYIYFDEESFTRSVLKHIKEIK